MLDATQLSKLRDDEKTRLASFEELFKTPGWKLVEEWARNTATEHRDRATFASTWEQNRTEIGLWRAYSEFMDLEKFTYQEFAALADGRVADRFIEEVELDI